MMRLIDADTLLEIFADRLAKVAERYGYDSAVTGAVSGAMKLIKYSPTVEPERKGKWIAQDGWDGDTYYECSECNQEFVLIEGTPQDNGYNYCPNCGAKMEE